MTTTRPRRTSDPEPDRAVLAETTAQRGEFVSGARERSFVCTIDRVRYGLETAGPLEIHGDEIERVRTFTDDSLAGFTMIGHLFLFVALLFSAASIQLFLAGAPLFDVVTAGTYFSTALAYPTAVTFYRMEVGRATVLRIETAEERFEFVSTESDCGFEAVVDEYSAGT